jgi:hypothetical protein
LIDHHLAAQRGLVTRAQLRAAGVTPRVLERLQRDELDVVLPAVLRHRSWPPSPHQAVLAAVLQFGRGAVASHRSALLVHGADRLHAAAPEVTLPDRRRADVAGVIVHRHPGLLEEERMVVDGIPVVTPARALVDLGAVVGPSTVRRVLEQWLARRVVALDDVWTCLELHR